MPPIVAVVAPGSMGAGLGRRLAENGATVLTSLYGRSAASAARAAASGMKAATDAELAAADFFLSVLPPSDALDLARRFAPVFAASAKKPVFVECNAVTPETVSRIEAALAGTGCAFVDGSIIGGPPRPGDKGPTLYVSGSQARSLDPLARHGLEIAVMDGPVGAASALKMSYAGITKGLVALSAAMILGAARYGTERELRHELAASQPALTDWLSRHLPGMYGKAYRWVGEMEEISSFLAADAAGRDIYAAIARLYQRLADDKAGAGAEIAVLDGFMNAPRK